MRSIVRTLAVLAALAVWSAEPPSDEDLEAAADSMSTEDLVKDAKRYLESGLAMHLQAIEETISTTQVRIRQGVTQPQHVCLRTFLASAIKQRKRLVDSEAIRTPIGVLSIMAVSDPEDARELAKEINVVSVSVTVRLTVGHNELQNCLFE